MKDLNLYIAVPTHSGRIDARLVNWIMFNAPKGAHVDFTVGIAPLARARQQIVERFLSSKADYLLMVDDDTIPPQGAIEKLLNLNVDVATAITPILGGAGIYFNIFPEVEDVEKKQITKDHPLITAGKPIPIKGCGLACVLIKRSVFDTLTAPFFQDLFFPNGNFCEGDLFFCEQVLKAGGSIIADPTVQCKHIKSVML